MIRPNLAALALALDWHDLRSIAQGLNSLSARNFERLTEKAETGEWSGLWW